MSTRKTGAERRRLLAEAASRVIEREGERGATVRAITAEAGMPLSTFHYIYETRADVIQDVYELRRTADEHFEVPDVPAGAKVSDVVAAMLSQWFVSLQEDRLNDLGEMEIITHSIRTPGLQHLPALFQRDYEDRVIRAIEYGAGKLGQRPTVDVRDIARMILVVSNGATYQYLRSKESVDPRIFSVLMAGLDQFFEPVPVEAEGGGADADAGLVTSIIEAVPDGAERSEGDVAEPLRPAAG